MEAKKELISKIKAELEKEVIVSEIGAAIKELKAEFVKINKEELEKARKEYNESGEIKEEFKAPFDEFDAEFSELMAEYNKRRKEWESSRADELKANLEVKKKIIADLEKLVEEENHIGPAFEKFNALKEKWHETGDVPSSEFRDLRRNYSQVLERFFYNINIFKTLKEYDLQKNLQLKQEMTEKVKALSDVKSIKEVNDLIHRYVGEWDEIGPTHQDKWEKVRDEFWESVREVHKRIADHYKGIKENQKENFDKKEELCKKVEELNKKDLTDIKEWNKALKDLNKIREDWKAIGFAGKKKNDQIWQRFRGLVSDFYDKKKGYQEEMKDVFAEHEAAKNKLIERAEEIKESLDWKKTAETYRKLQADWKKIGPTVPKREQRLWKKFRAASDHFFNRRKDYFDGQEDREKANLEKKQELLKKLEAVKTTDQSKSMSELEDIGKEWNATGFVPKNEKKKLDDAYQKTLKAKLKEIGLKGQEIEDKSYEMKLEGIKEADNSPELMRKELSGLYDKLKKVESEIQQYENNLGFFGDNASTNPLVKQVLDNIENSKQEAEKIKSRIESLTSTAS